MLADPDSMARRSLHRLLLLVATEPNPVRLRHRVDQEVDLLRAAMSLYAGMKHPDGITAGRIERVCQIYDVDLPAFMNGLGVIVGASVGTDVPAPAGTVGGWGRSPQGLDSTPTFGANRLAPSSPMKTPGGDRARRRILLGCSTMALMAVLLMTAFHAGGSVAPAPLPAVVAEQPAAHAELAPPATLFRSAADTPGDHWLRLASNAKKDLMPVASDQPGTVGELDSSSGR